MRLSKNEIEAIKEVTRTVFGPGATVRLFGSRTDDQKKGGDIDLYIQYTQPFSGTERYSLKIKFLVQLKKRIGDQKIDVLIEEDKTTRTLFHSIQKESIRL